MAASKKTSNDAVVDAVQEEAAPDAHINLEPAPNNSARPNDIPLAEPALPNSSFRDRAKATAKNKRVDASAADSK
jgi:hypothetical protein